MFLWVRAHVYAGEQSHVCSYSYRGQKSTWSVFLAWLASEL